MIALLGAFLAAAMFWLSQGPADIWLLAWIAPLPLLWLAYGGTRPWLLFLAAAGAFAAGQLWVITVYWGFLFAARIVHMVAALAILFGAAIVFAQQAWRRLPPLAAQFAFPTAWTAMEYAVSRISPHGSFGMLGYTQTSFPAAI